jgi:hypothetical protein
MLKNNGLPIKNITLGNLYEMFRIVGGKVQVNTITVGDIFEVDLTEVTYPLMHVATNNASFDTHNLTYNFQVIVMDLVSKDESNEEYVLADSLQTIGDIISFIRNSTIGLPNLDDFRNNVRIQDNITCEPFTERFDNEVTGWTADLSIEVVFESSACDGDI